MNATVDHRGEFDEVFVEATHVHIERMNNRGFWIGIDLRDGGRINVNTGIADGTWFFNVEEDAENGQFYSVEKPATYRKRATA